MISFIVIGRNESWKLSKCLESVAATIKQNQLKNYEIIYVDSNSTDDSIDRANKFEEIKIFKITGKYNAAIARNIGAKESSGDILFFIDGDMEIQGDFLPLVYNEGKGLLYDFVSGQFINYNYDYEHRLLSKSENLKMETDTIEFTTGGLFLIKKDLWQRVSGMKNKLRINEDIDLAIRLAGIGVFLIRKKELLAIHHTISYHDTRRTWAMLFNGSLFYRSVLMRDNILNSYQWKLFIRENYSSILLLSVAVLYFIIKLPMLLILYLIAIFIRVAKKNISILQKLNLFIFFFFRDIGTWLALLLFWPSNKIQLEYKRL